MDLKILGLLLLFFLHRKLQPQNLLLALEYSCDGIKASHKMDLLKLIWKSKL